MLHYLRCAFAVFFAGLLAFAPIALCADDTKEYLVKAAFIYNFVKFVEWPDDKAIAKVSSIDVCVLGDSPLIDTSSVFNTASTSKLTLKLVPEQNWRNAPQHCHILFISSSEQGRLAEILSGLRNQPVLTVSDIGHFADSGGMMGFVESDNKVRLEVNATSISAAGMRADAQLLEIALRVIGR